ncbi:hypothetical protein J1N35_043855 [Gossypium stocksii]|uniref:Uncharacterized protein n=1 Tax=Gossypium stocksii TaxID=47602 RepID=A0A9D3U8E4_9ROSI|nr:hypothetical protein J1N35_043855 [Gossypium stocksii]
MLSSSSTKIANTNEDDISSSEEIITKKVRFKDPDAPPDDVMVVDPVLVPALSKGNGNFCGAQNAWKKPWNRNLTQQAI